MLLPLRMRLMRATLVVPDGEPEKHLGSGTPVHGQGTRLGHEHLQQALLEVAQLGPHGLVHRPRRRRVLRRDDDAVPFRQAAPVARV